METGEIKRIIFKEKENLFTSESYINNNGIKYTTSDFGKWRNKNFEKIINLKSDELYDLISCMSKIICEYQLTINFKGKINEK